MGSEHSDLNVFPTEDLETLFIFSNSSVQLVVEAAMLNLISGQMKTFSVDSLQIDNSSEIKSINKWMNGSGKYLILKKEIQLRSSLYSYDSNTDEITKLVDGFDASSFKIIQDDSGRYVYFLGNKGNDINILDTQEKAFENNVFPLEEYWSISVYNSGSEVFYDKVNRKMITEIKQNDWGLKKPLIIDLGTLTCQYINGLLPRDQSSDNPMFLDYYQSPNILLISGGKLPYIEAVYLDTGVIKTSSRSSIKRIIGVYLEEMITPNLSATLVVMNFAVINLLAGRNFSMQG